MTVKSLNYGSGTAQIMLTGTIRPDGLAGYFNDIAVAGFCQVSDQSFTKIAFINPSNGHGATASASGTFTLPLTDTYALCGNVQTTTKSGHTYHSPVVCKNS